MKARGLVLMISAAVSLFGQLPIQRAFIARGVEEYRTPSGSPQTGWQVTIYRDAQGRESKVSKYRRGTVAEIDDPVARTNFWVSYPQRLAYQRRGTTSNPVFPPQPIPWIAATDLGGRIVAGFRTQGVRSVVLAETSPDGNWQERWYSRELQMDLLKIRTIAEDMIEILRITEVRFDDPPESVFRFPSDFYINTEMMLMGVH